MPNLPRLAWLVIVAMVMFAAGVIVYVRGGNANEHILGGVAILGAVAIVVANVTGDGQGK